MDNNHRFALHIHGHRRNALPRTLLRTWDHLIACVERHPTRDGHLLCCPSNQQGKYQGEEAGHGELISGAFDRQKCANVAAVL